MRRPSAWLWVLLPALSWAAKAPPKDPLEEMSKGEFRSALELLDRQLERTADAARAAELHLLRAQCFHAIGKAPKARAAVEQALRRDPEAKLPAALENPAMTELIESVRGSLTAELIVSGDARDADVLIDGRSSGPPPLRITVPIGRRQVTLAAPGFEPAKKQVVVRVEGGEVSFSSADLKAIEKQPPPLEHPALPPPPPPLMPKVVSDVPPPPPPAKSRLLPGLLTGGGAVLVAAGAVGTAISLGTKSRFDAQQSDPHLLEGGVTRAQAQTAQTLFVISLSAAAAGLVLGGIGVFGLLSRGDAAVAVLPLDGGAAFALAVRL